MEDVEITKLAAQVVEAFASQNRLAAADLPALIAVVRQSLAAAVSGPQDEPVELRLTPSQIRKSLQSDYLVSFEDGRSYRVLKRHLTLRGLTPDEYRQKWGLPSDYPMTAPSYSAARSALAKALGLGRKGATPTAAEPPPAPAAATLQSERKSNAKRTRKPRVKASKSGADPG